jgi:subtilisin family serine protease
MTGSVSTNATLAAIKKASEDGADVLNLSYGDFRSGSYTDVRYANALGSAMQRGALVAIASGNDGVFGECAGMTLANALYCDIAYLDAAVPGSLASDISPFSCRQGSCSLRRNVVIVLRCYFI